MPASGTVRCLHLGLLLLIVAANTGEATLYLFNWWTTTNLQGPGGSVSITQSQYQPYLKLRWEITVQEGKKIVFDFVYLDIQSESDSETYTSKCEFDYLAIHDGISNSSPLLRKYCSPIQHGRPCALQTSSNTGLVEFRTDNSEEKRSGFLLQFWSIDVSAKPENLTRNVATGGEASQVTTYETDNSMASQAIDGIFETDYCQTKKCAVTAKQSAGDWWQVDLKIVYTITSLAITTRESAASRLSKFYISVSNSSDGSRAQECAMDLLPYAASETRGYLCPASFKGRYLRIQYIADKLEYLQLCEVQVFAVGEEPPGCRWSGAACTTERPETLTAQTGEVGSPTLHTVGKYPPNSDCSWKITASNSLKIVLKLASLNLSESDVFKVQESDGTSILLDQNSPVGTEITSAGSYVMVTFTSNNVDENGGFLLSYHVKQEEFSLITHGTKYTIQNSTKDCAQVGGNVSMFNFAEEWKWIIDALYKYAEEYGVSLLPDVWAAGFVSKLGTLSSGDTYYQEYSANAPYCLVFRTTQTGNNINVYVLGVECYSQTVNNSGVLCEYKNASLKMNTHTTVSKSHLLQDENKTSCITVEQRNSPIQMIAEIQISTDKDLAPEKYVIVEMLVKDVECDSITFYSIVKTSYSCKTKTSTGSVGEIIKNAIALNTCLFKLQCEVDESVCGFSGVFGLEFSSDATKAQICEVLLV